MADDRIVNGEIGRLLVGSCQCRDRPARPNMIVMATYGTLEWARATGGGRLGGIERARQMAEAVKFQVAARLRGRPAAVGAASEAELDRMLREIVLPDTEPVAKAAALVRELGPPELAHHVFRSWAWAALFGLRDGVTVDRELLALASLLHDLGLARRHAESTTCFAFDGANHAESLLESWGVADPRREEIAEAICLHLRIAVPVEMGAVAHLLHAGAAADVVGSGLHTVPAELKARVFSEHALGDFGEVLSMLLTRESQAHPDSRAALWVSLGFLDRIRKNTAKEHA
jgi:hypothetical protein